MMYIDVSDEKHLQLYVIQPDGLIIKIVHLGRMVHLDSTVSNCNIIHGEWGSEV